MVLLQEQVYKSWATLFFRDSDKSIDLCESVKKTPGPTLPKCSCSSTSLNFSKMLIFSVPFFGAKIIIRYLKPQNILTQNLAPKLSSTFFKKLRMVLLQEQVLKTWTTLFCRDRSNQLISLYDQSLKKSPGPTLPKCSCSSTIFDFLSAKTMQKKFERIKTDIADTWAHWQHAYFFYC